MRYLFTLITVLILCSCGGTERSDLLERASEAARQGEYAEAVSLCDELTASADTASLTAGDYCRVAMIYAIAADNDISRDTNMAIAARWLDHAGGMSQDSVRTFFSNLPPEHMSVLYQLQQLNLTRGVDFSTLDEHEDMYLETDTSSNENAEQ